MSDGEGYLASHHQATYCPGIAMDRKSRSFKKVSLAISEGRKKRHTFDLKIALSPLIDLIIGWGSRSDTWIFLAGGSSYPSSSDGNEYKQLVPYVEPKKKPRSIKSMVTTPFNTRMEDPASAPPCKFGQKTWFPLHRNGSATVKIWKEKGNPS